MTQTQPEYFQTEHDQSIRGLHLFQPLAKQVGRALIGPLNASEVVLKVGFLEDVEPDEPVLAEVGVHPHPAGPRSIVEGMLRTGLDRPLEADFDRIEWRWWNYRA